MENEAKAVQGFMQTMVNLSVDMHNAREQLENLHLVLTGADFGEANRERKLLARRVRELAGSMSAFVAAQQRMGDKIQRMAGIN